MRRGALDKPEKKADKHVGLIMCSRKFVLLERMKKRRETRGLIMCNGKLFVLY